MSEFSKTALKHFRRLPKEEMLRILVELSNYAEEQKAMSMILISRMKEMEQYVSKEDMDKVNKLMKPDSTPTEATESEKNEVSNV